jgi:uncharacterized protein
VVNFRTIPEGEARDASWRMADGGGAQVFRLRRVSYGFVAQGVVHAEEDGAGYGLTVTLAMGRDWVLRMARLSCTNGQELALDHDGEGNWTLDGRPAPHLTGCIDIDIWPTPFTNTLPVLRLPWRKGESREFTMAYVKAPDLQVYPDRQRYTSLGGNQFRFEAVDGDFAADIDFDGHGLVTDYPPLFYRVQGPENQ